MVENPKNHAPEQHSDNPTTRSVRKRKPTINPTPISKPDNRPNGLPTPTRIDSSISRTNPAKKLVSPHLQFGEIVETRHFTSSEPPITYDHEEHNKRCEQHLSTGNEDGKFTSSTNTTVKLRPKKTTHTGILTTRPTTIPQNDPYLKAPPTKPTSITPTSTATRTTIPNFMTEKH